jgi:hypothetical protein
VHGARTLGAVGTLFPMYELSVDGIGEAVEGLVAAA